MAKMTLPKPSAETIAYFERIAPGPPIEARKMFGMPVRFLNGHMLVGLFGDTFMLHLSPTDREECIRAGAKPFAPMGRESKSYVDVKPGTFDDRTLKEWIVRGMRYLGKLPPKLKTPRAPSGSETAVSSKRTGGGAVQSGGKTETNGVGARRAGGKAKTKTKTKTNGVGARRAGGKTKTDGVGARRAVGKTKTDGVGARRAGGKAKTDGVEARRAVVGAKTKTNGVGARRAKTNGAGTRLAAAKASTNGAGNARAAVTAKTNGGRPGVQTAAPGREKAAAKRTKAGPATRKSAGSARLLRGTGERAKKPTPKSRKTRP